MKIGGRGGDEGANHPDSGSLGSGAQSGIELEPQNYAVGLIGSPLPDLG